MRKVKKIGKNKQIHQNREILFIFNGLECFMVKNSRPEMLDKISLKGQHLKISQIITKRKILLTPHLTQQYKISLDQPSHA